MFLGSPYVIHAFAESGFCEIAAIIVGFIRSLPILLPSQGFFQSPLIIYSLDFIRLMLVLLVFLSVNFIRSTILLPVRGFWSPPILVMFF